MTSWRFRALDFTFEVVCRLPQLDKRLAMLLAGYEVLSPDEPNILYRYELNTDGLLRDQERSYTSRNHEDLLEFFQLEFYRRIVENSHHRWLLHAAAVSLGGQVVVFAGPSNAGKSTLCRALLRRGCQYLSEEIVSLGYRDVDALRRPLHLESEEELSTLPNSFSALALREGPSPVWIANAKSPTLPRLEQLEVAALVRLEYRPEERTSLRQLDEPEALTQLWQCRMNTGIKVAQLAATRVATTPCFELCAQDRKSGAEALLGLIS